MRGEHWRRESKYDSQSKCVAIDDEERVLLPGLES